MNSFVCLSVSCIHLFVCLSGVVNGVGAVLDSMLRRKSGHVINMSSDAGRRGFAGLAVYSGTKFFVEGFSQVGAISFLSSKLLDSVEILLPGAKPTNIYRC